MVKLRKGKGGNQGNGNSKRKYGNKGVWDTGTLGKGEVREKIGEM